MGRFRDGTSTRVAEDRMSGLGVGWVFSGR
jgi:hypothetical protein